MRLNPAERAYPSFNDPPHDRPVLSMSGEKRAFGILVAVIGSLVSVSALLMLVH